MKYIYKKICGTIYPGCSMLRKSLLDDIINALDGFDPGMIMNSAKWRCWIAVRDLYTCKFGAGFATRSGYQFYRWIPHKTSYSLLQRWLDFCYV